MATYQFQVELLPKDWAENNIFSAKQNQNVVEQVDCYKQYDFSIAWSNIIYSDEINKLISSILPKSKSWHENLLTWGDDKKSDIKIWLKDDDTIESITIRIDLRDKNTNLLKGILLFAKKLNCVFFLPEVMQVVDASLEYLYKFIYKSEAAKFTEDPKQYILKNCNKGIEG